MAQHGVETTRVDKVAHLAGSEVAMRRLRVCWENRDGTYNCGRCEKCRRTMVNLAVAGALGRCATLPSRLDLRMLSRAVPTDRNTRWFMEENLRAAERRTDPAGLALAGALRRGLGGNVRAARFRRDLRLRVAQGLKGTVAEAPLRRMRAARSVRSVRRRPRSSR